MIDIFVSETGGDLKTYNTQVEKAKNVLDVQLGSLEYAKELGIDLEYFFINEEFVFQNESFRAHMIERLSANMVNSSSVLTLIEKLYNEYTFNIGNEPTSGLIQG